MGVAASLGVVPAHAASPVKVGESDCSVSDVDKTSFATRLVLDCSFVGTLGDPENVKLDGTHVGAEAGVSVGAGVGANYLTGGFNGKLSLQPYSVEGKSGFGLNLGGQKFVLKSVPSTK